MWKVGLLLCKLSDDEDEPSPSATLDPMGDSSEPWLSSFNSYWNSKDHLREMMIVKWWSVHTYD